LCQLTNKPRPHFPGFHQVRRRLEHLGHQPLAPFPLSLEIAW
jgi:hypothetical protein